MLETDVYVNVGDRLAGDATASDVVPLIDEARLALEADPRLDGVEYSVSPVQRHSFATGHWSFEPGADPYIAIETAPPPLVG